MDTVTSTRHDHTDELSRLFYSFRLAHLNRRYYSERLARLKKLEFYFQLIVAVTTASSFALLLFSDFRYVRMLAAGLAAIAFIVSTVLPSFGFSRKVEDFTNKVCAFHYAAQQIEGALRFVKNAQPDEDGEVTGWVHSAEEAYHQAAALPDTEVEDRKLVKKIEDEINEAFPSSYVWTAF